MQTFIYDPAGYDAEGIITITGPEARHISSVLRLTKGALVRLTDGRGTAHICEIGDVGGKKVTCRVIKTVRGGGEPRLSLSLAVGLSTGAKFDTVIEKGTEVGVSRFVPLLTEKAKVKPVDKGAMTRKLNRWRRIAEAAVKQSGRSVIPEIDEPVSFDDYIASCDPAGTVIFHPADRADSLTEITGSATGDSLHLVIGPESGFSPGEMEMAAKRGIRAISLGDRVLRTETAGVVLAALVIYLHDSFKG